MLLASLQRLLTPGETLRSRNTSSGSLNPKRCLLSLVLQKEIEESVHGTFGDVALRGPGMQFSARALCREWALQSGQERRRAELTSVKSRQVSTPTEILRPGTMLQT